MDSARYLKMSYSYNCHK